MTAVYMQARINTNVETCKYVEKCSNFWCILKFQYIIYFSRSDHQEFAQYSKKKYYIEIYLHQKYYVFLGR